MQSIDNVQMDLDSVYGITVPQITYERSISQKPDIITPADLGDLAFEDAVEKAKLGTTIIDGGYLVTGMINASRIDTGTLNADRIATKSITGAKLADGTITPVQIDYLDAGDIIAGTLSLTSTGVGLKVLSGGDIEFESETYGSFSSILFKKKNVTNPYWNIYFTATTGGGYNEGELVFESGNNNQHVTIGSFANTTISRYTHLSVYGNLYANSCEFGSVIPKSDSNYDLGSSSKLWRYIYGDRFYVDSTRYIYVNSNRVTSSADIVASGSLHATGNLYTGGVNGESGSVNCSLVNSAKVNLRYAATNPSAAGDIVNYASGAIDQFRGRPGGGTWVGSFDMTAY